MILLTLLAIMIIVLAWYTRKAIVYVKWLATKVDSISKITNDNFTRFQQFIDMNNADHQIIFGKLSILTDSFESWSRYIKDHEQLHKEDSYVESGRDE